MKSLKESLQNYLETLSGVRPDLSPKMETALPLFLSERYEIFSARLFGKKLLLALEGEGWEGGSPSQYGEHVETMRKNLAAAVVLVLPILPSFARNRMVQMGIPFVVPGYQIFLPDSVIDLREHFPQPNPKAREKLSPAAQCTVLYHLLRSPLNGISLKEISQKVEYSPMMITKAKVELEAAGICKAVRNGRSMVLEFMAQGRSLWDLTLPRLNSPVKKTRWVQWQQPGHPASMAGITALSRRTMISDDRLPTYALTLPGFQDFLEKGVCVVCQDAEQATSSLQIWSYSPQLLGDATMVDPLSLYLSLKDSGDERVQQQLEQLIQEVKW